MSFGSTKDDHDVLGTLILVIFPSTLVLVGKMLPGGCIREHPSVDDAIFGEVGYRETMVLTWNVHDLTELDPVALLLLVASAPTLVLVIFLCYPGRPDPIWGNRSSLAEPPSVNHGDVPEPVKESRQDVVG